MRTIATMMLNRRMLVAAGLGAGVAHGAGTEGLPSRSLVFPRDAGAHPDYGIEWWYVTGYAVNLGNRVTFGFQVTFFRSRIPKTQNMVSSMAAKQLIFAHAAVTDLKARKLWHDQRLARSSGAPPGQNPADTAWTSTQDTQVRLRDWSLARQGADLQTNIQAHDFALALTLTASQPVLLQGEMGLSKKGPSTGHTSYYYSLPQLQVRGELVVQGQRHVIGAGSTAWLDHEWSQQIMPPQAVGWDWIGINLFDGSALTAFRLRDKNGEAVWDGGSFRANNKLFNFARGDVVFKPLRRWNSPLSRASYPVEWMVRTPADYYSIRALLDNQEMDSRASTGAIYWEGLCEVWDSNDRLVGRGYLEMTGYASPIRL